MRVVGSEILKGAAVSESLIHLHQEVNELCYVRILVNFKTEIWSYMFKTLFASLKKSKS